MSYRNFPMVSRVVFGRGSFNQLGEIIAEKRINSEAPFIFFVDDVFKGKSWVTSRIPLAYKDEVIYISADEEPKTSQVDELVEQIILKHSSRPSGIIGIGGGTILDLAKAVSIMLTNEGKAEDYQGWDLVKNPAIYHLGIPTISGTGAEVSRTAVLLGPNLKLGINSDYTPFDQVVLDPELTKNVPRDQWFYTGMDCFIHCIESLNGTFLNAFSETYGEMAYSLCKEVFLENDLPDTDLQDKLMMASWHGGMSIAYSQVGVAHALSYGLSYVLGIKHGIGNCMVFDKLEEFYPEGVSMFKKMKEHNNIELPQNICAPLLDEELDKMVEIALSLTPLWENALGKNWQKKITPEQLKEIYRKI
ncbi:MAG: iron-containing alcohol dehydrogenase family protein [Flavobacteriaceae bacterium]|nr:iron-containing alcohol dehydrogenase family protein [Flavobacteriaceae bacterium]